MKVIKSVINRIVFLPKKIKLKKCGRKVLFESKFEIIGPENISVGDNVRIKPGSLIAAISEHNNNYYYPDLIIHSNVSINYYVHIACINRIEIGENTLIGSKVFITDHEHGDTSLECLMVKPSDRLLCSKGPVIIGKNVWIGENVTILPGIKIGDNSVIGANAVVSSDIPPFSIAAGVPARIIKKYKE